MLWAVRREWVVNDGLLLFEEGRWLPCKVMFCRHLIQHSVCLHRYMCMRAIATKFLVKTMRAVSTAFGSTYTNWMRVYD